MKILYVIDACDGLTAGTEQQLFMLARGMVALGHDVRLLVLRHTDYSRTVSNFPCPIESLEVGSIASLGTLRRMLAFRARIRRDRPDVVHAFFNDSAILIPPFARNQRTRVFTSRRDMGFWHTPGRLMLLRLANAWTEGIICNSHAVAKLVQEKEGAPAHKLRVIYNGIEFASRARSSDSTDAPPGFSPANSAINICLVANLRPIKRVEDLVKAAAKVILRVPDCEFWIVGASLEEDYSARLSQLVRELGLTETVHFLGEVRDPQPIIRKCQVGVLTSQSEGLSNTLLEYMSGGLPAVCSDVGGNPELLHHGEHGYLYPCGDVAALAERLVTLCDDATLRDRMAIAALDRAQRFSTEANLQAHLEAYAGLAPSSRMTPDVRAM
jgi:L-malate glycosyltransferase